MSVQDANDVVRIGPDAEGGTGNALANIPVTPPKGRGPPVERVLNHGALLYGPAAEDCEAGAPGPGVVELGMGQAVTELAADGAEVVLDPALLQADNVRRRVEGGEATAYLGEAGGAQGRDVEEAPAVEGDEVEVLGGAVAVIILALVVIMAAAAAVVLVARHQGKGVVRQDRRWARTGGLPASSVPLVPDDLPRLAMRRLWAPVFPDRASHEGVCWALSFWGQETGEHVHSPYVTPSPQHSTMEGEEQLIVRIKRAPSRVTLAHPGLYRPGGKG